MLIAMIKGLVKVFEVIYEEGEKEWLDETKYRECLNELYVSLENGEISDEEYEEEEREILEQLRAIKKYKEERGYIEEN